MSSSLLLFNAKQNKNSEINLILPIFFSLNAIAVTLPSQVKDDGVRKTAVKRISGASREIPTATSTYRRSSKRQLTLHQNTQIMEQWMCNQNILGELSRFQLYRGALRASAEIFVGSVWLRPQNAPPFDASRTNFNISNGNND